MTKRKAARLRAKFPTTIILRRATYDDLQEAMYDFYADRNRLKYAGALLRFGAHREAIEWHLDNPGCCQAVCKE